METFRSPASKEADAVGAEHTIFRGVLESRLPPQEKTLARMTADAGTIMVAGTLTTTFYLALATYYLLASPGVLRRLKEELRAALGAPLPPGALLGTSRMVRLEELEKLPYLTAVIQEAFRLSYGSSSRLQRAAPEEELVYRDRGTGREWVVPKGVSGPPASSDRDRGVPENLGADRTCRRRWA